METTQTELQSLQNHVNSIKVEGLKVHEYYQEDKRRSVKKYFITILGTSISPKLDYDQMNHFLLGFSRAVKMYAPCQ